MAKLVGWRKVAVTLICFLASIGLLCYNKITGDQFVTFNQWLLPSFMASNLIERMVTKKGERNTEG